MRPSLTTGRDTKSRHRAAPTGHRCCSMVTDMVDSFASMTDSLPVYESLAVSVRRLIDATIRTEVSHDVIAAARAKIDSVTSELSAELMPGTFGERRVQDGQGVASGNVVIGVRNPSAPRWSSTTRATGRRGPSSRWGRLRRANGTCARRRFSHDPGPRARGHRAPTGTARLHRDADPALSPTHSAAAAVARRGLGRKSARCQDFRGRPDQRRRGRHGIRRRYLHPPA